MIVWNQVLLHNHPVANVLVKPRGVYTSHKARIMNLHFAGVSLKNIVEEIRHHCDFEPRVKGISSLIRRLKLKGWTAETCENESKHNGEAKTTRESEDAAEDEK